MVILRGSNKYSEIKKKISSDTKKGDSPLGRFVYVYLTCNKIETEEAQTHLQEVVLQPSTKNLLRKPMH